MLFWFFFPSEFHPRHCWRWWKCEVTWHGWKEDGLWVQGSRNKVSLFVLDAFNLLHHISPRCVSSVLGLQSKSGGQFYHGRLLRAGDGFKRRSHQNVEAPSKRGTPAYLSWIWCQNGVKMSFGAETSKIKDFQRLLGVFFLPSCF